ncbi:TraB/GumN family protein [Paenibacillus sp. JSM ZJ436]|uniref:TraB/GumN family protein n=1 Tax=Paenibacillus sp. JSM ZJ436 TaxID=3376190 RepID=UPI0037A4E713
MKKNWNQALLSLMISAGLLATAAAPAYAAPVSPAVSMEGQVLEYSTSKPMVEKGTTYVPLRWTLQELGAKLAQASEDTIYVITDGDSKILKAKLLKMNGVTYAPIRVVGEAAGYTVAWDAKTRTVILTASVKEAVQAAAGRGFMWEVESGGNTVYLVGSMHIADESFYPLRPEFDEAFAEADYLGVEIDVSKAADEAQQQLIMKLGMYQDGTTLKDHISADTYAKLGEVLRQSGIAPDALDVFKPWVVESTLGSLQASAAGYEAAAGIDLYFVQKAMEKSIPVLELESYESQLSMFNGFSQELQERNLNTALEQFNQLDQSVNQMAQMWKTGNEEQLLELTNSVSEDAEYVQAMLIDRNIGMADKIDGYLRNGKNEEYFIVVGAAHYLGEHGIIKLLEDKGYTVKRK